MEPGGCLLVSECGLVDGTPRVVYPHPNFRIFLSLDPAYGEVSRAMRNRGIEIFLPGSSHVPAPPLPGRPPLPPPLKGDLEMVLSAGGMGAGGETMAAMVRAHVEVLGLMAVNRSTGEECRTMRDTAPVFPQL
eukprot:1184802-Prorocentrum_minimum.AAC.1